jgi:quercetin 2,3-dioxygenase
VHFLQIWVLPDREGLKPRYDQKAFAASEKRGRLRLVGSPDGRDGSIVIHQDVELHDAQLARGEAVTRDLKSGRKSWVQVVRGAVEVNGKAAKTGDGVALQGEARLSITSQADDSEILVFDLP